MDPLAKTLTQPFTVIRDYERDSIFISKTEQEEQVTSELINIHHSFVDVVFSPR
jgi:hypothetical protein